MKHLMQKQPLDGDSFRKLLDQLQSVSLSLFGIIFPNVVKQEHILIQKLFYENYITPLQNLVYTILKTNSCYH